MECAEDVSSARALSLPCLDLSRRGITELPELKGCLHLQCLYLEGNSLSQLPPTLFSSCPNLQWLDLRNNLLTHLPPAIQLLRELKTLLLQGNQLASLPSELGELSQLNGLGLADNPLTSPPPHVVREGTNAVLSYLRDQLRVGKEEEEKDEEGGVGAKAESGKEIVSGGGRGVLGDPNTESEEEEWGDHHHHHLSPKSFSNKHYVSRRKTGRHPLMLHKQAQIHSHPPPTPPPLISYNNPGVERGGRRGVQAKRRDTVKERERQNKRGGERKRSNQAKPGTGQEKAIVVHVPPLSSEEKLQVNIKVEKQRSKECLEQWRAEAKIDHLKHSAPRPNSPTLSTADSAPYATDRQKSSPVPEFEQTSRLLTSSFRLPNEGHSLVVRERIERYNQVLQNRRQQAGLITEVSSDILEAERRLAEALAQRDEVEERKKKEYRLTAFTADPTLL